MPEQAPSGNKRKNTRTGCIVLGVLALLALLGATWNSLMRFSSRVSRDFISPYLNISVKGVTAAENAALLAKPKYQLVSALTFFRQRNSELAAENAVLKRIEEENRQLRVLARLPERPGFRPVTAEIIARPSSAWREAFVINRGSDDGVAQGDAVAAAALSGRVVLAGRIQDVSAHTSVVTTLFSEACRVSVSLDSDGSSGAMEYSRGTRNPIVKYLPVSAEFKPNGAVSTSGISGDLPSGLLVGTIVRADDGSLASVRDKITAEIEVSPLVPVNTLKFVTVFIRTRRNGALR